MAAVLRTLVLTVVLAGLVLVGYYRLSGDQQRRALAELRDLNEQMAERLAERQAMIDRLSRSSRLARVEITDQTRNDGGKVDQTGVLLIELDADGSEIARQSFAIPGDVLYIDAWTVKFDHEHVAQGHPLFGRSLVLLRRVYSEQIAPAEGFAIDTPGAVPPAYAAGTIGRFEQKIWAHFWDIATDADLARSMGVRVAQGEAVYKPVAAGQAYELIADAAGGISLRPLDRDDSRRNRLSQAHG